MHKQTIEQVSQWLEQAEPGELTQVIARAYITMLQRIVAGQANPDEMAGIEHALKTGWRVRFFHQVAAGTLSAELVRDDGSTQPLFEHDPTKCTRH